MNWTVLVGYSVIAALLVLNGFRLSRAAGRAHREAARRRARFYADARTNIDATARILGVPRA
jgi:hypothetical protein